MNACSCLAALLFLWSAAFVPAETTLTVSAAASLQKALGEIQALHAAAAPGVAVTFNFGGSGALATQIEHGAPVDVFLSAATKQMDALERAGSLAAGTRRDLLTNSLVLIAPRDSETVRTWEDLARPEVKRVAIGEPRSVPAGMYAAEVFARFKLSAAIEPKLVRMLDVRQVLMTVATGNAEAGVVYATDARGEEKVRVVATAPADWHSAIVYPIAVIQRSRVQEAARGFVEFLSSQPAREVFMRHGFGVVP